MENDFKRGDVVCLNSSSLAMTVVDIVNDLVTCVWLNSNNDIQDGAFYKECLKTSANEIKNS